MERIKQAIEKAKLQRTGEVAQPPVPERLVQSGHQPADAGVAEVSYSHTRVVRLNADHLERNRIVAFNKNDPMSLSFDILRTQVLRKMEENGWRTIAITSPTPECGKTVVSINLAISIAHQTNKTAMLVDFDLRRPTIGKYLGISAEKSLNEVLDGKADLSEALVNPGMAKLVVLPTSKPVAKSSETLSSKKVESLIKELRERYSERIVLFDLPPLLSTDDAIAVLPQVDCVLLVVGNGMVAKSELEESIRHLHAANLIGTVLNKAETSQKNYYY